jgi:hypothetical protein
MSQTNIKKNMEIKKEFIQITTKPIGKFSILLIIGKCKSKLQ